MNDASMGFPRVGEMHPEKKHGCALSAGPDERDRLLVPFLQEGLRHGDECVCLIDGVEPGSLRRRAHGPAGPDDVRRTGHLGVYPAADVCPRAGELSVKQALTLLASTVGSTSDGGFLTGNADTGCPTSFETAEPGVLAVGDVRSGSTKRVASAVGEGAIAVRQAFDRLRAPGRN